MNKFYFTKIFLLLLLLFLSKWFFSFYFNFNENFITKIIFDLKDWQYLTFIYNFSNLDFNPSYDPELLNLKYISIPINSVIFHSIFLKIFNLYGFLIIEFIFILLFFYILIKFFGKLGVNNYESIFLTLFIFCIPSIIDILGLYKFAYVSALKEFYNLRVPRPLVTQIYFLLFLLLLIIKNKNQKFKFWELSVIGILFSSMWGSFYYNLAISGISFAIYYFYINNFQISKVSYYIKDAVIVIIFFIIFSLPLILILLNSEPNYLVRVGLINLDLNKKIIILEHFFDKLISLEFLIVFFILTVSYIYLKNKNTYKTEGINLLYIIFLSSFLAPIIFVILSPTISEIYHFMNSLVAISFFVLTVFIFLIFSYLTQNISINKYILTLAMGLMIVFYTSNNYFKMKNNSLNNDRLDFNSLVNELNNLKINKKDSILTFDGMAQTHLILQGYTNLPFVISVHTPQNDEILENKIIDIFKFLNLSKDDFLKFIHNKKSGWRYINNNIGKTFYMKYQANRLITYKNSMDFSDEEIKYILKSSPLHTQQLIIPKFEIKRLVNKFIKYDNKSLLNPELIIINLKDQFSRNLKLKNNFFYCSKKINETYLLYYNKENNVCS